MSHAMDAPTSTGAMHDVYEQKKSSFEEFGKKIRPVKGQTGAACLVGDTFAGLDLFDQPSSLKALFPKLLSAVAVEAMMAWVGGKERSKTDQSSEEKVRKGEEYEDLGVLTLIVDGAIRQLNLVGAEIWTRINSVNTVGKIAAEVASLFGADTGEMQDDVLEFLKEVEGKGWITPFRGSRPSVPQVENQVIS